MFINIFGLAVGMAAAILILLWVRNEVSFDRIYKKTERIYIVGGVDTWNGETIVNFSTPKIMATAIHASYPEVEDVTRVSGSDGYLLRAGEKGLVSDRGVFVDSSFFDVFDLPALSGDPAFMLKDPGSIVITESLAERLYGTTDVVGKTIKIDSTDVMMVSGVLQDIPSNSRFYKTEYFFPWTYLEKLGPLDTSWGNNSGQTYISLKPHADLQQAQEHFKGLTQRHHESEVVNFLKPIAETHLYNAYENAVVSGGRIDIVRIFVLIACAILLIACINFMNLSTAQSERRVKEVGVRKTMGAERSGLIVQFLSESILLAIISGIIALIVVSLCLPSFNALVDRDLSLNLDDRSTWIYLVAFVLFTGILAGSYPAFLFAASKPLKIIKRTQKNTLKGISVRKLLVITQFSIAVILIISTLIIRQQVQYGQKRDTGYTQENLIYVREFGDIEKNTSSIKYALLNQGIASSITRTMSPLTERWSNWMGFQWAGKAPDNTTVFNRFTADDKLLETTGLTLIKGRDFDLDAFSTDSFAAIINESAVEAMGFENPIGKTIVDGDKKFQIIGVINDFIQESPFYSVNPLIIEGAGGGRLHTLNIKLNPHVDTEEAITRMRSIFTEFNPNYPFEYEFTDEAYAVKFEESVQLRRLTSLFAFLTIFISCLGLYGLAAFTAEQRTKEIGIRKVLGASVFSITRLMSIDFLSLVLIACFIAFPVAFWIMDVFLHGFSYRISLSWQVFTVSGICALLLALITVSYQSVKAATANPADSLRDE